MTTSTARRLLSQAQVTVPLTDIEMHVLAGSVGLTIGPPIDLPDGVGGALIRGTFFHRQGLERPKYRCAIVYAIARRYLYGPEDSCLCYLAGPAGGEPTGLDGQKKRRAALLAGALILGPNYEPAMTAADLEMVADLAGMPEGAVKLYQEILDETEYQRDVWRFPELGRDLRRRATLAEATAQSLLALSMPVLAYATLLE